MSQDQLDLIINNSDWNEEKREWTVPNFVYKERMVNLPKLQSGRDTNDDKDKKEVIFRNSYRNAAGKKEKEDSFRINHIVRGARENHDAVSTPVIPARSNSNFNRAQLTPLKNDAV